MKKVLIGFIFVLCLVGGVAIGKIRQKAKAPSGGGLVTDGGHSDPAASPEESPAEMAAADATETPADAMAAETPADAMAGETPTEVASADTSTMDSTMTAPTPEVSSDPAAVSGRTFGTGTKSRKSSRSSSSSGSEFSGSSSSSASSAIADSSFSEPAPKRAKAAGTPIPENQVIDVSTPSDDFGAGSDSSFDVPPASGSKSKTPAVASNELDDLPVIDDSGAATSDPFADTGSTGSSASAAPTPDPFANAVAMAPSGGGGELVFPSGSGRTLKKVTQKQNGAATVVRIDMSSSAKYRVYKTRAGKVFVDIEETDVPGGASQTVSGSGQVKEISAKPVTNAGGMKLARVQILVNVTNEKLPNISSESTGNAITVTVGGASSEF